MIPEITASLLFGWVMVHLLHNNRRSAVVAGGIFFIIAALLMPRVEDLHDAREPGRAAVRNAAAVEP